MQFKKQVDLVDPYTPVSLAVDIDDPLFRYHPQCGVERGLHHPEPPPWTPIFGFPYCFREMLVGCASLREFECQEIIWSEPTQAFTANLRRLKILGRCNIPFPSPSEGLLVS